MADRIPLLALAAALAAACAPASACASAVTGVLTETHGDLLDGTETPSTFAVVGPAGTLRLTRPQPEALVGRTVTAGGSARDVVKAVGAAPKPAPAAGPRRVLVVLVALPDGPPQVITPDTARAAIFTDPVSSAALYAQQSGGATTLSGDVAGPYSVPVSAAGCPTDTIADAADQAAIAGGWAPGSYDHVLYVLPSLAACDWAGLGQMPGRRAWTNGDLDTRVVAHELGHNLGANHASALHCTGADGAPAALSASCTSDEYGDPFDVMGLPARLMSSWHRAQVGQLAADRILSVTGPGTYVLTSADELGALGPQLLLVPRKQPGRPVTSWLAVERRSLLAPFDTYDADAPVTTGLTIRAVPALGVAAQSQLLDATPETPSVLDAPLQPGRAFNDGLDGVTITAQPDGSAQVAMAPLVDDVPPTPPAVMTISAAAGMVHVRWTTATDDVGVDHYEVERDGVVVGRTAAPTTAYDDAVQGPRTVRYRVLAVDAAGNRGATNSSTITVPAPPDVRAQGAAIPGRPSLRSRRLRRVRGGWIITLRVVAMRATRISATVGGHRVAVGYTTALTFRLRYPDGARRRTVTVRASNAAGGNHATWVFSA